jgi:5-hydroxyisourate hydrolase-like protein (transthyretin family)
MIALLLAAALAVQGVGGLQPGTGIVSGVLKTTDGRPASGVRVGAVDAEDPASTSLLSVTETDANGKYRLTNIPAGRYYIVAGRLNALRYYPSGGDRSTAAEVEVGAARIRADVNFKVPGGSQRLGAASSPRVVAAANSAETLAYQKIAAEADLSRKAQFVTQFEKDFYYGFMANRRRKEKLEHCRQYLAMAEPVPQPEAPGDYRDRAEQVTGVSLRLCPVCRQRTMIPIRMLAPVFPRSPFQDSS